MAHPILGTHETLARAIAARESSNDMTVTSHSLNPEQGKVTGYLGLYQIGEGAFSDMGWYKDSNTKKLDWKGTWDVAAIEKSTGLDIGQIVKQYNQAHAGKDITIQDGKINGQDGAWLFMNCEELNHHAHMLYVKSAEATFERLGTYSYIDKKEFTFEGKTYPITKEGLLFAAQLGPKHAHDFAKDQTPFKDSKETAIAEYFALGAQVSGHMGQLSIPAHIASTTETPTLNTLIAAESTAAMAQHMGYKLGAKGEDNCIDCSGWVERVLTKIYDANPTLLPDNFTSVINNHSDGIISGLETSGFPVKNVMANATTLPVGTLIAANTGSHNFEGDDRSERGIDHIGIVFEKDGNLYVSESNGSSGVTETLLETWLSSYSDLYIVDPLANVRAKELGEAFQTAGNIAAFATTIEPPPAPKSPTLQETQKPEERAASPNSHDIIAKLMKSKSLIGKFAGFVAMAINETNKDDTLHTTADIHYQGDASPGDELNPRIAGIQNKPGSRSLNG